MTRLLSLFIVLFLFSFSAFGQGWERFDAPGGAIVLQLEQTQSSDFTLTDQGVFQKKPNNNVWEKLAVPSDLLEGTHQFSVKGNKMLLAHDSTVVFWDMTTKEGEMIFAPPFPQIENSPKVIATHITEEGYLVMTNRYLYFSWDAGHTWEVKVESDQLGVAHSDMVGFDFFSESNSALFFIDKFDVHRSFDDGRTWDLAFASSSRIKLFYCSEGYQFLFYGGYPRVARSSNNFLSWEFFDQEDDAILFYEDSFWFDVVEYQDTLFCFSKNAVTCLQPMAYSVDTGAEWFPYLRYQSSFIEHYPQINDIKVVDGKCILAAPYGLYSVFEDQDTNMVHQTNFGIDAINEIAVSESKVYVSTKSGVYGSEKAVQQWDAVHNFYAISPYYSMDCKLGAWDYLSSKNEGAYTVDDGRAVLYLDFKEDTWEPVDFPSFVYDHFGTISKGLILSDYNKFYFFDMEEQVPKEIQLPISFANLDKDVYAQEDYLVLKDEQSSTHYYSEDIGLNWESFEFATPGALLFFGQIEAKLTAIFAVGNNRYIVKDVLSGSENIIFIQDWSKGVLFNGLHKFEKVGDVFFILAADNKIYYSPDLTGRFYPFAADVLNESVVTAFRADDTSLWVGTEVNGLFRIDLAGYPSSTDEFPDFEIYPNPIEHTLQIKSDLLTEAPCSMRVLGVDGKLLLEGSLYPGQSWSFDISHFPSGVYFLEIKNAEQREVLKFIKQ